jgi:hypothetical protein
MYDGPFCVLSAVDGPHQRRIRYEALEHDPTHRDIRRFLRRLKAAIVARNGQIRGVTTDGSALYPEPLAEVFAGIPHQVCAFHLLKELIKAVLRVVSRIRKRLAGEAPKRQRGRPPRDRQTQRQVRRAKRIERRVAELFKHRHLFVRHHLSPARRRQVQQLCRGQRQLRAVRQIMDEVYRLFDRRCRTGTALTKLERLRQKLRRYRSLGRSLDKLKSPNLEKAIVFLDERLLGATSNAAERGNRRVRKMQKTVYRVRTKESLCGRLALDLQRDEQSSGRHTTTETLHEGRKQQK